MYVDNMGRPREIIEKTDAKAGDDVYLTIDGDLQIAIYKLIGSSWPVSSLPSPVR